MNRSAFLLGLILLSAAGSRPLEGQVRPDSMKHRNDCRLAAQVVEHGQPANKRQWALRLIPQCGAVGGAALANALRAHGSAERPDSELESLVMLASILRDANVFAAAAEIAASPTVHRVTRIQAIRVLYYQLERGLTDPYESFLSSDDAMVYVPISDYPSTEGAPLPPDVGSRAAAIASRILDQPNLHPDVCAAAEKLAAAAAFAQP